MILAALAMLVPPFVPASSPMWHFSPYNWRVEGTSVVTNNTGSWVRIGFTGPHCELIIESPGDGRVLVGLDTGELQERKIYAGQNRLRFIAAGNHTMTLHVWNMPRSWKPDEAFKVLGLAGAAFPLAKPRRAKAVVFGDSLSSAPHHFTPRALRTMGFEYGVVAFPGQGISACAPQCSAPPAVESWSLHCEGRSRLVRKALHPQPDVVLIALGLNDEWLTEPTTARAELSRMLAEIRNAAPSAQIGVVIPPGRQLAEDIRSAVISHQRLEQDFACSVIDLGPDASPGLAKLTHIETARSFDGIHPKPETHRELSGLLKPHIVRLLDAGAKSWLQ